MSLPDILTIVDALHQACKTLSVQLGRHPERNSLFGRLFFGHDRFDPRPTYLPLLGRNRQPSAHEQLAARVSEQNVTALLSTLQGLLGAYSLLRSPSTFSLDLGLTQNGHPSFLLSVDGLTPWGCNKPVMRKGFEKRLTHLLDALTFLDKQPGPLSLYHFTKLDQTVAAPSPEMAVLKAVALLRPQEIRDPKAQEIGLGTPCLFLDKEKVLDDVASLFRQCSATP